MTPSAPGSGADPTGTPPRPDAPSLPDAPHPSAEIDDTVHQRTRLGILSVLDDADEADFTYLRTALGLTDGNLGRHLEILVTAEYVTLRKGHDGRRARTWARITPRGRAAFASEVELLRVLLRLDARP